jgi:hypothetical protein
MRIIDLHGARYKDVYGLLEHACVHEEVPFEVITGNSTRMKKIVIEVIRGFNLIAREKLGNDGALVIYESR